MHFSALNIAVFAALLQTTRAAQPYSTWMSDSFLPTTVSEPRSYPQAVLYRGLESVYNATGDSTYFTYIKTHIDQIVSSSGILGDGYTSSKLSLDDIRIGPTLLYLYQATNDSRYKNAASQLRGQLDIQPRTPSGGFWHRKPAYPNQMWLDGIFMADPFYAQWTSLFDPDNTDIWDDIVLQYDLIESHCRNVTSGLLVHGYDESKEAVWADPVTGAAPHVWIRALGWYAMALVDVLDFIPVNHPGYERLVRYLNTLADGVKKAQDASGGWWLVMDEPYPGMGGNYIESSGTAMFAYALLKGSRLGYIDGASYVGTAKAAYDLMTKKFVVNNGNGGLNWEGTVEVGSLGSDGSYSYYISVPMDLNDLKGVGSFILASVEIERLT